jgi:GH25 family lysozyme M1 (1,4-beta-N-acetylmuramidase)
MTELPPLPDPGELVDLDPADDHGMTAGGDLVTSLAHLDAVVAEQVATFTPSSGVIENGFDMSSYDGSPDYRRLRAANYKFGWRKVSQGTGFRSPGFAAGLTGMRSAGIRTAGYHWLEPGDGARQCDFMLATMGLPQAGDMPPLIDAEVPGLTIAMLNAFSDRCKARTGAYAGVYASLSYWQNTLKGGKGLRRSYVNIARYGATSRGSSSQFWQWTSSGRPPGTGGSTDMDVAYVNTANLSMAVLRGAKPTPPPVETGPPGVYPYGPTGHRPLESVHTVAKRGDDWQSLVDRYYANGGHPTTNPKAIRQWHLTHGGEAKIGGWADLGGGLIIMPKGSPGVLA